MPKRGQGRGRGFPIDRSQHVSHAHIELTLNAFQQYLNLSNRELARRLGWTKETQVNSLKRGRITCHKEYSIKLHRELGYLIDDYVDENQNVLPDKLVDAVVDYLDSLIQPFEVKK